MSHLNTFLGGEHFPETGKGEAVWKSLNGKSEFRTKYHFSVAVMTAVC